CARHGGSYYSNW
nr:immunoglobulin heavy chain junction region [Macaca mulatta]